MANVQPAAVAGMFYPADPLQLSAEIRSYVRQAQTDTNATAIPKALIAPHAGYIYSGPVAGSAYACLAPWSQLISRVVILAPAHRLAFSGVAYSGAAAFRTPLGDVEVDLDAVRQIARFPQVTQCDAAFRGEHSIEVHLPFLQEVLVDFKIVPLLVGDARPEQVDELLELLWGGDETLILVSSDLSHYLSYEVARTMDQEASRAIEALRPDALRYHHACGRIPVSGLLLAARRHRLSAKTLDLRNSGDTAGSRERVVGYGAYLLC
ncbi:MAG: AmmeMemoRadiSam system protein B [Gammaproteobacteria bacterium]|nr:AmmeMemoRadiSam system protein B [Gammaproteobacteria bacterium]